MTHSVEHDLSNNHVPRSKSHQGKFGRLFRELEPWVPPGIGDAEIDAGIRAYAHEHMFADAGVMATDHPSLTAGYTYLGQFIDHDITFDPTSSMARQNDPDLLNNFRTPRFDLDSIYGRGPHDQPYLFDTNRKDKSGFAGYFLIGKGVNENEPDLPRNSLGTALIGDKRNDENVIVSQIHLTFLKLHNVILARAAHGEPASQEQFKKAQQVVRWFYQYVVWHDFVKRVVDGAIWASAFKQIDGVWRANREYYNAKVNAFIPVEFSVAAYRFGHALVRPTYKINTVVAFDDERISDTRPGPFGASRPLPIFNPDGSQTKDLRGGRQLRKGHTIQWDWFFPFAHQPAHGFPQKTQTIGPKLARSVFAIPSGSDPKDPGALITHPLAFLNIKRGWRLGLPSGSAVAKKLGQPPLDMETPYEDALWVYILREAQHSGANPGERLGPVGSIIVSHVIAGWLGNDEQSFFSKAPNWTPADEPLIALSEPENGGQWSFADILKLAGMPIDTDQTENLINGVTV